MMTESKNLSVRVIPKEKAVFWMDAQGRWCNASGPFEHKKIIQYFNASIDKDEEGYFVSQDYNGMCEKVYFRYQVTPLFALDVIEAEPMRLVLNTGKAIPLVAENLYLQDDHLYLSLGDDECAKITERVLFRLAGHFKDENG
ncbi:MAG: MFS transporter permease, partial [Desulfosarcinaceae bacterium]